VRRRRHANVVTYVREEEAKEGAAAEAEDGGGYARCRDWKFLSMQSVAFASVVCLRSSL